MEFANNKFIPNGKCLDLIVTDKVISSINQSMRNNIEISFKAQSRVDSTANLINVLSDLGEPNLKESKEFREAKSKISNGDIKRLFVVMPDDINNGKFISMLFFVN